VHPQDEGWPVPEVPDLDSAIYDKSILNLMLNRLSGQVSPISATVYGHKTLLNLVRLSDKAAREYRAARERCLDFGA
jgi:hypothetical protein